MALLTLSRDDERLVDLPTSWSNAGRREQLQKAAAESFSNLVALAVAKSGANFQLYDALRPIEEQKEIFFDRYRVTNWGSKRNNSDRWYQGKVWWKVKGANAAAPGMSNHGSGLAVDIHPGPIQEIFKTDGPAWGWSWAEGRKNGESWHFVFVGGNRYASRGWLDHAWVQKVVGAEVDGKIGTGTVKLIKAWQKKHGLNADGIVGPATKKAMQGKGDPAPAIPSIPAGGTSVPTPRPASEYTIERHQTKNLRPGRIDEKRGLTGELNAITLHHWGSDGQDFDNVVSWLVADGNGNNSSSAHEVIEGGRVAVLASIEDGTWNSGSAQGNLDNYALECRPEADDATVRTVAARVAAVRAEAGWDVPLNLHRDYVATECPGRYVELRDTIDRLSRGEDIPAATTPTTGGELPTGKELLVKLTDVPDFPLLRTPGHLCYYGDASGPIESVSGKSPNSLNPGEIFGTGKKSGAYGLKTWQKKAGIEADGRFGAGTEAKVREVQRKAGLTVDSKLGPSTWYALWLVS